MDLKHIAICVALMATPASSGTATEMCAALGTMAEKIMTARQNEVPLSISLSITEGVEEPFKTLATSVILDAYRLPGYESLSLQRQAVKNFRNRWEVRCIESLVGNV